MIDHDVRDLRPVCPEVDADPVARRGAGARQFADAHANVAQDDVIGADLDLIAEDGDARRWCRFAGDRDVRVVDWQLLRQEDFAADLEDDTSPTAHRQRRAEAARSAIGECGDLDCRAAVAAFGRPFGEAWLAGDDQEGEGNGPPEGVRPEIGGRGHRQHQPATAR